MEKIQVGVIGSSSMVGSRFCQMASSHFDLVKSDLHGQISVDITQKKPVADFFENNDFDWLILFSAFTDVDTAEKQRQDKNGSCWKINVEGTANVVDLCRSYNRNLIFISTDFVFDGTLGPYSEDDPTGPDLEKVSWYGIGKIEAEKRIKDRLKNYIIARIAYPYRSKFPPKDDIAKRILRLYRANKLYPMFVDQVISPTFIDDLAPALSVLISQNQRGTFHLASPQPTTQFEFAKELIAVFGGDPAKIRKGSIEEYLQDPNSTPRPVNGGLKVGKISQAGFEPTGWEKGIREIFKQSKGQLL